MQTALRQEGWGSKWIIYRTG